MLEEQRCDIVDGKVRCPVFSDPRKIYDRNDSRTRTINEPADASVARDPNPFKATKDAIDAIGGMCKYVKENDLVAVKVNITGGTSTNPASFTNPDVVKEVIDEVRDCGGKPFIVDSSMIWTNLEDIARKEGWYEFGEKNDVEIVDLHHMPVVPFNFGDDSVINIDKASKPILDADVLINVPVIKTHLLTTNTLGLKNNYGLLPRSDKGVYHAKGIDIVIGEVNRAHPTTLTVLDGTIAGEGEAGPLTPDVIEDYNTVIASNNVVCGDAVASKMMGFRNPVKNIRHLKMASLMGLGDATCYEKTPIKERMDAVMGTHPKDGNFVKPDPRVIENLTDLTKTISANPGGASMLSNLADAFLKNMSYYLSGVMKAMLKGFTRLQKRYIGKDMPYDRNPHGLNLHGEDSMDSYLY